MAKPQIKDETETVLELKYILGNLPSAQHKTGLAGLVLLLETMKERKIGPVPEVEEKPGETWIFRFTKESFQTVFDEFYDGTLMEIESASKWKNAELLEIREREVEKDGKKKLEKRFVYETTVPKGAFFEGLFPEGVEGIKKLKLWRDVLWATYRGKPAARAVYAERQQKKQCSFAGEIWKSLLRNNESVDSFAGTLQLGAEGFNAEKVLFIGLLSENILLHFTSLASALFVVRNFIVKKGKKDSKSGFTAEWNDNGYVLVMPEILQIRPYLEALREWYGTGAEETRSFRPLSSLIDLPEESGLEFLSAITGRRLEKKGVLDAVEGVEYYHMAKKGNSVKVLSSARIPLSAGTLNEYNSLVSSNGNKISLNFLYKTVRIRNLLNEVPWYTGMESFLETYPSRFFIWPKEGYPRNIQFFGLDINKKMKTITQQLEQEAKLMKENGACGTNLGSMEDERLAIKVRNIVRRFVIEELKDRLKTKLPEGKTHLEKRMGDGTVHYTPEYSETVSKICASAFLALRGRKGAEIAEFFTGSLCSIPQYLRSDFKNKENDDYLLVAKSLVDPEACDKIKLFAMLALSACSFVFSPREEQNLTGIEEQ